MTKLRLTTIVIAASLALLACGGDDNGTATPRSQRTTVPAAGSDPANAGKRAFIAQADAICRAAQDKEAEARALGSERSYDFLKARVRILRDTVAQVRRLKPPRGDEERVERWVAAFAAVRDARAKLLKAIRTENGRLESAAERDFESAFLDLAAYAGGYGLTSCQAVGT